MHAFTAVTLLCAGLAAAYPHPHPAHHRGGRKSGSASSTGVEVPAASATKVPVASATKVPAAATTAVVVPVVSATPVASATAVASAGSGSTGSSGVYQPASGASWQIVLSEQIDAAATLDPDVDIYDIDMFGNDAATVAQLHAKGKKVICYFSAGSYEPYRADSSQFTSSDMGNTLDGWPDEKWLDIDSANVRSIMTARIQLAASKGCDGIDPDNVDGFANDNGLGLTAAQTTEYVKFLADTATASGMSIGLKNALDLITDLIDVVHFAVNEQCHAYDECDYFLPFASANKPVFNIEYPSSAPSDASSSTINNLCSSLNGAATSALSTVMKTMDLDGWVQFCDSTTATTTTG